MTARILIGPWPGSNVVAFPDDVRVEFARRVEQRAYEMECEEAAKWARAVSVMHGSYKDEDATPCA